MNKDNLCKAHDFLKTHLYSFEQLDILDLNYRYEHSLRVYQLGLKVCATEAYDDEVLPLACLVNLTLKKRLTMAGYPPRWYSLF